MNATQPRISAGRRQILAAMVAHVATQTFADRKHQEFWVALLGVESRYESSARSSVGAVGLGQLMPQYTNDFGKGCSIAKLDKGDVLDDFTNLTLSACFFRSLIDQADGSVALAMVFYNAGPNSKGATAARRGDAPAIETSNYVTTIHLRRDKAKKAKDAP